jgi:hypothetical protein
VAADLATTAGAPADGAGAADLITPTGARADGAGAADLATPTGARADGGGAASAGARAAAPAARGGCCWLAATLTLTIGSAVAAIALAPAGTAPASEGLAFLLFAGSSAHVASTAWFYTVPEVRGHMLRHPARYVWTPLALLAGAGAAALLIPRVAVYWLLLGYFAWQFFHYQKQNLGIAALAASALQVPPLSKAERRALIASGLAAIGGLLARPGLLQLPIRAILARFFPVAVAGFAIAVAVGIWFLARRAARHRPAGFAVAYVTSLAFGLPVFVFRSPYAAVAGLTVAHGLQYLLLMSLVAAGSGRGRRALHLAALANIALLGGAFLAVASDQLRDTGAGRMLFGLFAGAVMAHFVIDAGLWRMRDEFPRGFLSRRLPYLLPTPAARR